MKQNGLSDIRLIAVDLDGTLLNREKAVSPRTLQVIESCRKRGILFAFATGRCEAAAGGYLRQLAPDAAVLAYGAQVMLHGQTVASRHMSPRVAAEVLRGVRHAGRIRYQLRDGRCYDTEPAEDCELLDWDSVIKQPVQSISVWNLNREEARALVQRAGCSLTQLIGDRWCNFSARGTGKGPGMRRVMKALGVERGQAIAFGDESCDVEFFRECGTGVAMGNADEYTLAHADYHTESNDCDGIAAFLERYVLP
jgi:hypothetical protein